MAEVPAVGGVAAYGASGGTLALIGLKCGSVSVLKGYCFAAGTPILTRAGDRPIESIAVGDLVLAYDRQRDVLEERPVTAVHRGRADALHALSMGREILFSTAEHPFLTDAGEWRAAGAIGAGDRLFAAGGGSVQVKDVAVGHRPADVFNLEVEGTHTYVVGTSAVVVHNTCLTQLVRAVERVLGAKAADFEYTQGGGQIVSYAQYKLMRAHQRAGGFLNLPGSFFGLEGNHAVFAHGFRRAVSPILRPLENYVPTHMLDRYEHQVTFHYEAFNRWAKEQGYWKASLTDKQIVRMVEETAQWWRDHDHHHVADAVMEFLNRAVKPLVR
jgi:hypothetical protein